MENAKITISPKTRVGELLENYPHLEEVLIKMSPAFAKLKNPVLRKTVAKVATLQQIAVVGGLNIENLINELRKETGQAFTQSEIVKSEYVVTNPPDWFDQTKIISVFDASPVISSGGSPMKDILAVARKLKTNEIFEIHTPFVPAPVIDMVKAEGFNVFCIQDSTIVRSYMIRQG